MEQTLRWFLKSILVTDLVELEFQLLKKVNYLMKQVDSAHETAMNTINTI